METSTRQFFECCASLTKGSTCSPMAWVSLSCGPETTRRVAAYRPRHMTFASTVCSAPCLTNRTSNQQGSDRKKQGINCSDGSTGEGTSNRNIATIKWFEQVVLEEGDTQSKKLTYLHDKASVQTPNCYLSFNPLMYGAIIRHDRALSCVSDRSLACSDCFSFSWFLFDGACIVRCFSRRVCIVCFTLVLF